MSDCETALKVVEAARWIAELERIRTHAKCGRSCIWRGLIDALKAHDEAEARA